MCEGEDHNFRNDVIITQMVIYHGEILAAEYTTILVDEDVMVNKEREMTMKGCTLTQRYCDTNEGVYTWMNIPP